MWFARKGISKLCSSLRSQVGLRVPRTPYRGNGCRLLPTNTLFIPASHQLRGAAASSVIVAFVFVGIERYGKGPVSVDCQNRIMWTEILCSDASRGIGRSGWKIICIKTVHI